MDKITIQEMDYIKYTLSDINGIARSKLVPARIADKFAERGIGFYSSILLGPSNELPLHLPTIDIGGNINAKPISKHISILPWSGKDGTYKVGELLCEPVWVDQSPIVGHPRFVALKQLEHLEKMGFKLYSTFEVECTIFEKSTNKPASKSSFLSGFGLSKFEDLFCYFEKNLHAYGVNVEIMHTEYDPGQIEVTFEPQFGIEAADNIFKYKNAMNMMKEMCGKKGLHVTFMTRPLHGGFSNLNHFNHSLWEINTGKNVLHDTEKENKLSSNAMHYIGGLIKHHKALTALCSPTSSCYRRFRQPGTPNKADWAIDNRFASFRVKNYSEKETYIENRLPGGSCNPYIVLAATLAAGMDGIKNSLQCPDARPGMKENECAEDLVLCLKDAIDHLVEDTVMVDKLGREFIDWFVYCKKTYDLEKFGGHNIKEEILAEVELERKEFWELM